MNTVETLQKITDLRNETAKLSNEIRPLIEDWLKAKSIYFDSIEDFSFNDSIFSVSYVIYGRWGGSDDTNYCEIPIGYFAAEDKAAFIASHTESENEKQRRLEAAEAARLNLVAQEREKAQYERLKAKFEKP